jgi:hypothetical protein
LTLLGASAFASKNSDEFFSNQSSLTRRLLPRRCGSSKMPQHFLEPAMPLAMAASPNIAISGYNHKRVSDKFIKREK